MCAVVWLVIDQLIAYGVPHHSNPSVRDALFVIAGLPAGAAWIFSSNLIIWALAPGTSRQTPPMGVEIQFATRRGEEAREDH